MRKVDLEAKPRYDWSSVCRAPKPIRRLPPFARSLNKRRNRVWMLAHRVRYAQIHWSTKNPEEISHASMEFWCGNQGFVDYYRVKAGDRRRGHELLDAVERGAPECAACETKAIQFGHGTNDDPV